MERRKRTTFTKSFKQEAVRLLEQSGNERCLSPYTSPTDRRSSSPFMFG